MDSFKDRDFKYITFNEYLCGSVTCKDKNFSTKSAF